jgi:hypothetical protein
MGFLQHTQLQTRHIRLKRVGSTTNSTSSAKMEVMLVTMMTVLLLVVLLLMQHALICTAKKANS